MSEKRAIIIGAGPAGLTSAYELLEKTDIKVLVFEAGEEFGGISKTVEYKGNRIDLGGHRFFSKSDRVMNWWLNILPLEGDPATSLSPERDDLVMLVRNRLSRILFLRKLFDYPISPNFRTFANLGLIRVVKIVLSYLKIKLFPIRKERSLEDFFTNRFGKELNATFFRDYTEKVWGVPCSQIKPEWGAQRVKGLSISKAVIHAIRKLVFTNSSVRQKGVETTLIEKFIYPKYGPGQMWQEVAYRVRRMGGEIHLNHKVDGVCTKGTSVTGVTVRDEKTGEQKTVPCDYLFSTMAVKDLIESWIGQVPEEVREVARALPYRDFMTVGLLVKRLKLKDRVGQRHGGNGLIKDNWIYIQESDMKVGRLQIFNNWSPYMVKDKDKVWIGLEYFCNEGDELWNKSDTEFLRFAIDEVEKVGIADREDVLDGVVLRMQKTYPAYFGSYEKFGRIREFTDRFSNLFLIGRNGMHRYNNQDHSMLTAMIAVENIMNGIKGKDNIWNVNTEEEYHEGK